MREPNQSATAVHQNICGETAPRSSEPVFRHWQRSVAGSVLTLLDLSFLRHGFGDVPHLSDTRREAAVCACAVEEEFCAEVTTSILPVDGAALGTFDVVHVLDPLERIKHLKFAETESTFDYFQATREYLDRRAHTRGQPVAFYSDRHGVFRVDTTGAIQGGGSAPTSSRVSELLHNPVWRYRLQDRNLMGVRFDSPTTWITQRQLGSMTICNGGDRFAAQIDVGGGGIDGYCFCAMLDGHASLIQNGTETSGAGANGIVFRATPGTRLLASDTNTRENLWIEASTLEHALESMLGTGCTNLSPSSQDSTGPAGSPPA